MQHFHALLRSVLLLFRAVSGAVVADDVYSREWEERGWPGDGI
jgi:hypothetical protein